MPLRGTPWPPDTSATSWVFFEIRHVSGVPSPHTGTWTSFPAPPLILEAAHVANGGSLETGRLVQEVGVPRGR